jgi:NitT/TauT family transport system substrate-binding protein
MIRKVLVCLTALALVVATVAGCSGNSSQGKKLKKVSLSEVAHSVFYAPQYAALSLGFFEDEGLEIDVITGQGADKVMTSVVSGEVDIGFPAPRRRFMCSTKAAIITQGFRPDDQTRRVFSGGKGA